MKMHEYKAKYTIYINNLNEKIKINDLKKSLYAIFLQFGTIAEIMASKSLRMRGQAFVIFHNADSAANALTAMNEFPFYGKPMKIQLAKIDSDIVTKRLGTYVPRPRRLPKVSEKKKNRNNLNNDDENNDMHMQAGILPGVMPGVMVPNIPMSGHAEPDYIVEDAPNKILFLENLPAEVNLPVLTMLFSQFRGFKEVRLVPERPGIAFVEFDDEICSSEARHSLNGCNVTPEHVLEVAFAKK